MSQTSKSRPQAGFTPGGFAPSGPFTPGPWIFGDNGVLIAPESGTIVLCAIMDWVRAPHVEDRWLIEAAPELCAAAAMMAADYQTSEQHHPEHVLVSLAAFSALRNALAKALGNVEPAAHASEESPS